MKKMTRFFSGVITMTLLLLIACSLPASASKAATIADYQSAFNEIVKKYNLEGIVSCEITETPQESLSSFSYRYEQLFSSISEHIVKSSPEQMDMFTASISSRTTNIATPYSNAFPESGFKYCGLYFRIYCAYRKEGGVVKAVQNESILGSTTLAGALMAFTFTQSGLGWHRLNNSDGSADVFCKGKWIDNKNNVPVVMGDPYTLSVRVS